MKNKKDSSPVVPQRNVFKETFEIKEPQWTPKQKEFINLVLDKNTKIIFLDGPAGSSKVILVFF
jgi:predicted ribonuclease YlaK